MPPEHYFFSRLHACRLALIGTLVAFHLSVIHQLTISLDSHLPSVAHRAEPDVRMTINVMITDFKGTLNTLAVSGIRRHIEVYKGFIVEEDENSSVCTCNMEKPHMQYDLKNGAEVRVYSVEKWRDDLNDEEGLD